MKEPPYRCLFCLSSTQRFDTAEHPIPESLGSGNFLLSPGFVCDECNQYLGSKLEKDALKAMPFIAERMCLNVRTKKGKSARMEYPEYFSVYPTSFRDVLLFAGAPWVVEHLVSGKVLNIPAQREEDLTIARFLLKMGLEVHACRDEVDVYSPHFDPARRFVRARQKGACWAYAMGRYPRIDDLVISQRTVDCEQYVTDQLYTYESGIMANGEVVFFFMYRDHVFAVNLSSPDIREYVDAFNAMNEFSLRIQVCASN